MKRVSLFVVLLLPGLLLAANVQNKTVTVTTSATSEWVEYEVTLIHTGAATDNVYSQAIELDGLLLEGATIQAKSLSGTTGRDVNIDVEGSNLLADSTFEKYQTRAEFDDFSPDGGGLEQTVLLDRNFNKANTIATFLASQLSLGGQSIVAVADTSADTDVVYVEKDPALRCKYIRVISDGQSGNNATSSTLIILRFRKDPNFKKATQLYGVFNTTS